MHSVGWNNLAKNKGNKWYDWDKKKYIDKGEWFKPNSEEIVNQIHKPKGHLIKKTKLYCKLIKVKVLLIICNVSIYKNQQLN